MAPSVLFVVNDPIAPAALLGEAFAARGFDTATLPVVPDEHTDQPALNVRFPEPSRYDAVVVLGARWAVYDEALQRSWVADEAQFVRDADAAGVPLLGVCFGGQLVAHAHGGAVTRSPAPELGWAHIDSRDETVLPAGEWFQWHFDRWSVPPAATEIARNANASQAFVLRRTLALQFHPELDAAVLDAWLDNGREEVRHVGADPDDMRSRTAQLAEQSPARVAALVDGFLTQVATQRIG